MSPADLARLALRRIAELGLPPTPQNYHRFYDEAAGQLPSPKEPSTDTARAVVAQVKEIVENVSDTTGSLVAVIGEHQEEIQNSLAKIDEHGSEEDVLDLLDGIVRVTHSMHKNVHNSHIELVAIRQLIEDIRDSLHYHQESTTGEQGAAVLHRQALDQQLKDYVRQAHLNHSKLSIMLLDFAPILHNAARHGQLVSEKALNYTINHTKSLLRESDVFVRYTADAFLLVLPDTDINGASFLGDRLRASLNKMPYVEEEVSISLQFYGSVAQLQETESGYSLILRADRALLKAKTPGQSSLQIAVVTERHHSQR